MHTAILRRIAPDSARHQGSFLNKTHVSGSVHKGDIPRKIPCLMSASESTYPPEAKAMRTDELGLC